jgi:hypothetical protein
MIDFLNENKEIISNEKEVKFSFSLEMMLFLFSVACVYLSIDYFVLSPSSRFISNYFLNGFMNPKFFSLFDFLIILLSFHLIIYQNTHIKNATTSELFLFLCAIVCFILKMANPNNSSENPVLGLPLFSEINYFSYLLFFGTIMSLPQKVFFKLVYKIFTYSAYFAVFRSIVLLVLFAGGQSKGFFFGIKSCLIEGDTLLILGFFQSVILAIFFITSKKKYLIAWSVLVLIQIFSTRRSPLFTALFCNAIVFGYFYIRKMKPVQKLVTILSIVFILFVLPGILANVSPKAKVYIDRYIGVFSTETYSTDAANSDSGHFEQSQKTTDAALKLGFWGFGYGHKLMLEGAFSINGEYFIHNVFAALWALNGAFMIIFYLIMIIFVLYHFFNTLLYNGENFENGLIKISVVIFFLMYMHAMYYTTLNFVVSSKMEYILQLVVCFILKFRTKDLNFISLYKNNALEENPGIENYIKF